MPADVSININALNMKYFVTHQVSSWFPKVVGVTHPNDTHECYKWVEAGVKALPAAFAAGNAQSEHDQTCALAANHAASSLESQRGERTSR
jgi:hypothetical protein